MDAEPRPPRRVPRSKSGNVDFDVTGSSRTETVQINLDANDPMSEADFHLAYGLYDEAALLLKQAADKNPERKELRVKLAETYFAAGKPVEFEQVAEALKDAAAAVGMAEARDPGPAAVAGLARSSRTSAAGTWRTDLDLAFDEPSRRCRLSRRPRARAAAPPQRAAGGLEFKLESSSCPSSTSPPCLRRA